MLTAVWLSQIKPKETGQGSRPMHQDIKCPGVIASSSSSIFSSSPFNSDGTGSRSASPTLRRLDHSRLRGFIGSFFSASQNLLCPYCYYTQIWSGLWHSCQMATTLSQAPPIEPFPLSFLSPDNTKAGIIVCTVLCLSWLSFTPFG